MHWGSRVEVSSGVGIYADYIGERGKIVGDPQFWHDGHKLWRVMLDKDFDDRPQFYDFLETNLRQLSALEQLAETVGD